ncbi:MAG TPA: hypothetical protein VFN42_10870, partial [Acetobacteraceae bacterium]|nr:hypothetical protein [Acetobacteraceae bacterium]
GGLLLARDASGEARELLLRCCGIAPGRAEAWHALGLALAATGDTALAHTAFIEAQRLEPSAPEHALRGIEAAQAAGDAEPELARLEALGREDPFNPVWPLARGMLLECLGNRSAAIDALEAAAVLAPDAPLPAALLAGVLARSQQHREANAALQRAIALDPENTDLSNMRAVVLMRMQRHAEALALLLELQQRCGDSAALLSNLANASVYLGLHDAAIDSLRRAMAMDPEAVLPRRVLCNVLPYCDGTTGVQLLAALRNCAECAPCEAPAVLGNLPDPDRKLTVGLLSGSLKTHPVAWLTLAGFETLDPAQFALVCLVQNPKPHDLMARRFRVIAREWIETDALNDAALAQTARDAGVDVLIDLGGYGEGSRMQACRHRLAPVQIKWVGMQSHSSGLPEMDWMLTDRWETPPGSEHLYSEHLLRLPDGYVCYTPPPYAPDIVTLPAMANGHVTFGCFNNLAKITTRVVAVWAAILHRVPGARMVLKTHQFVDPPTCDRIRDAFVQHGITADRIDLRGPSRHRAFLGEYNGIDIVLDPFPYSGGLTTCEALWMGVPTITMPGDFFAARHSFSHLSNAGLAGWAADDLASYIELAVAKAADLDALAALRAGLRARVKASPLCDAPRFGRNLGAALRHAWQTWCWQ